jgi:hypothetical protein
MYNQFPPLEGARGRIPKTLKSEKNKIVIKIRNRRLQVEI